MLAETGPDRAIAELNGEARFENKDLGRHNKPSKTTFNPGKS